MRKAKAPYTIYTLKSSIFVFVLPGAFVYSCVYVFVRHQGGRCSQVHVCVSSR
jgi:hypothetical protein